MTIIKRFTAALFAVALAISFTACKKTSSDKSDPASSTTGSSSNGESTSVEEVPDNSTGSDSGSQATNSSSGTSGAKNTNNTTKKANTGFVKPKYDLKGKEIIIWTGEGAPKKRIYCIKAGRKLKKSITAP